MENILASNSIESSGSDGSESDGSEVGSNIFHSKLRCLFIFFLHFQVYFLLSTDLQIVDDLRCSDPNLVTIIRSENLGTQLLSR